LHGSQRDAKPVMIIIVRNVLVNVARRKLSVADEMSGFGSGRSVRFFGGVPNRGIGLRPLFDELLASLALR